jgi:hypothetical protein
MIRSDIVETVYLPQILKYGLDRFNLAYFGGQHERLVFITARS